MKALMLYGKGDIRLEEVPTPKCPDDGLLLKVDAVGLCGSDVRTYLHGHHGVKYPQILGHENVGIIEEVGKDVEGYSVGERVMMHPAIPCGKCWYCQNGKHSLCVYRPTYGTDVPGGFAQYMTVPGYGLERGLVLKIPDGVESNEVVVVELLSSILNAQELVNVGIGDTVVIIGAGPIGCLHSEIARIRGAKKIIMADLNQERLDMCKKFSGTDFINSGEKDVVKEVLNLTEGFGADEVIVAAPATEPHQQGLEMLRKQGRLAIFGGLNKENPWSKLDGNLIHYNELTVVGTYGYNLPTFKKAFDIVVNNMLSNSIVSHVMPLEDMPKGVELIQKGEALKVILKPWA